LLRIVLATFWFGMAAAVAAPAGPGAGGKAETPDQAVVAALRQSIGAPARAAIGDQATVRLAGDLVLVPAAPARSLLVAAGKAVPADLQAVLLGAGGIDLAGVIRFVPAGFVDADAARAWTEGDFLASLQDTVAGGNPARAQRGEDALEARRWVQAPHYDAERHQLSWAALILPQSAPGESDGGITYHAIGFGRDGYVELSIGGSLQQADTMADMAHRFLGGLTFLPRKGYEDAHPGDRRAPGGLAAAMGMDSLHKDNGRGSFWGSDKVMPVAGGIVAAIGALWGLIYVQRHLRREARRG